MTVGRAWMVGLLATLSLAGAGPGPALPRVPQPPAALSFSETRRYVERSAQIVRELAPGDLAVRPTPQGPRRVLLLRYRGQDVSFAYLGPQLELVGAGGLPLLSDAPDPSPALGADDQAALTRRLRNLSVSGLVQAVGPQVRTYLLDAGRPVAELHFDRNSGALLPDGGQPLPGGPGGPHGRPHP